MSYVPSFTQDDADEFAASVVGLLPQGVGVEGVTLDAGSRIGVAVMLPNGRRHAVATADPYMKPEVVAEALGLWLDDMGQA